VTVHTWSTASVAEALGLPRGVRDHVYTGICTDTRSAREGDLYVALAGERFDGHDFLSDARLAGVWGVVVRRRTPPWPGFDWFEVEDTLASYGRLARARRDAFAGQVVAVTGTNGKTSTKELAAAAAGAALRVHKSEKNLNNLVGVPLTLLAMPAEAQAALIECGANQRGELAKLREIVRPDIVVVTGVDAGHLEGFGGIDRIIEEKLSLAAGAPLAIVGPKPAHLADAARALAKRVVTVAADGPADWTAEDVRVGPDGHATFLVRGVEVTLPVLGRHQVGNALLALAVADALGVPLVDAARGLAAAALPGGRTAMVEREGVTVINDTYNANPASLAAALDLLQAVRGPRRTVVVVGTMRELGAASADFHAALAERILDQRPDVVAAVGDFAPALDALAGRYGATRVLTGATPADVAPGLKAELRPGDVALFKASRGVRLEQLFPLLWPSSSEGGEAH
jgi:UDP-N-acetylmuramoyl-tripeptide--D-alanyl-D-alanine ligase